ncbi:serine hydrolase domain-containing protein [Aurantiacibacter sediminis]|uniref:Beta-lactamase family protein n=1 Tax=Aurantiacibacter sediminis TaxID=2793064 RepID=A0ABS0N488_9SPHN|nr:serine hydrolase domain-containing protein [Aurantiacibacter sediminis]MBH5322075.1 beta-lactamase family protein [Aurantiacibacter sediminis]
MLLRWLIGLGIAAASVHAGSAQASSSCYPLPSQQPTEAEREQARFTSDYTYEAFDLYERANELGVLLAVSIPEGVTDFSVRIACERIGAYYGPLASITKQMTAILVMQAVERGELELDRPADVYLPSLAGDLPAPTIRQLLQHQTGLRNPDDSARDADGVPAFHRLEMVAFVDGPEGSILSSDTGANVEWCLAGRESNPTEGWRYNNCDYVVLGEILEAATGRDFAELVDGLAQQASAGHITVPGLSGRWISLKDEGSPQIDLLTYGASGNLVGSLEAVARLDRALMDGRLLSRQSRETMWESDPSLGYMALGQWVFEAPLAGCAAPVRIVERRGEIGNTQLRNLVFPDHDRALVLASTQEGFDFGEIWQQSGPTFELASKFVCDIESEA